MARSPLPWLVIAAILALLAGVLVPSLVVGRSIRLADDVEFHAVTEPAAVLVETGATTVRMDNTYITSPNEEDDALVQLDTTKDFYRMTEGQPENRSAHLSASLTLNRESAYPEAGHASHQSFAVRQLNLGASIDNGDMEGLTAFFPADTEQRSYPYFDFIAQEAVPIDYTGKSKRGGIDVYEFHQHIDALPAQDILARTAEYATENDPTFTPEDLRRRGRAGDFYTNEELAHFGLKKDTAVVLDSFYSVDRTVTVDPATGTILDLDENISFVWATDAKQARDTSIPPERRAVFVGDLHWDQTTQDAALELARPTVRLHKAMGLVSWVGKGLAVALLAAAGLTYLRRRDHV